MDYWDGDHTGYGNQNDLIHHSNQNLIVTNDFINIISCDKYIIKQKFEPGITSDKIELLKNILNNSLSLIEFGCGTGEFIFELQKKYNNIKYLGTDISYKSINYASEKYSNDKLKYIRFNALEENVENLGKFTIGLCSNCLEHFKDPYFLVNEMLKITEYLIILVPFNQNPMTDGYNTEGGAGHIFKFVQDSFSMYNVLFEFKFFTNGWVCGEDPLQWCVILKNK